MSHWLLWVLGLGGSVTSETSSLSLHWARPGFLIAGLLLIVPVTWWVYYRQQRNIPHIGRSPRWVMTACRVMVFLLLMLVLAGPYLRIEEQVSRPPVIAVIEDVSNSMSMQAGPFEAEEVQAIHAMQQTDAESRPTLNQHQAIQNISRATLATELLQGPLRQLEEETSEQFDWQHYQVNRVVREAVPRKDATSKLSLADEAEGHETALGAAIESVFADNAGRRIGAIVLLTDGRHTTGQAPLAVLRRRLHHAKTHPPVIPLAIGASKPKPDIAVVDVLAPQQVTLGDTVNILATVQASGYEGEVVEVELTTNDDVLHREQLTLSGNLQQQQVSLPYEPKAVGATTLRLLVKPQSQEVLTNNNERDVAIQVDDTSLKMLYIEGYPRWDFRFLDHELRRDRGLDATMVVETSLRAAGIPESELPAAGQLPLTREAFAAYDVVMLGDVSPQMLQPLMVEALREAVREDGVGLIVQAGLRHMPHDFVGRHDHGLASLLPVTIQQRTPIPGNSYTRGGELAPAFQPFSMRVTASGSLFPAFHLFADASRNRALWSQMPPFYWAASASRPKAGATELAKVITAEGEFPLIASQFAGRGRVLFVGTDSTYRWRRNIGSALFSRFWGQAIRHVARRENAASDRSFISAYPTRVEPGERVNVELYAVDEAGKPIAEEILDVQWLEPQSPNTPNASKPLTLSRAGDGGYFRGSIMPAAIGEHAVIYTTATGEAITASVHVAGSQRETMFADVDTAGLTQMADLTGGRMLRPDQVRDMMSLIEAEPVKFQRVIEEEVWDNWLMLVLLVGLYCVDVGTRRVLGLT